MKTEMDAAALKRTKAMYQYIYGNWTTMVVYVYAELGIADVLLEHPSTAAEIAVATSTDPAALERILRCAEVLGLHTSAPETGKLELSELGKLLCSGVDGSLRAASRLNGAAYRYAPWGQLLDYARTGTGQGISPTWEEGSLPYLSDRPELLAVFEQAMAQLSRRTQGGLDENQLIAETVDWSAYERVLDIGGGSGALASAIAAAHADIQCVLFDLPEVVAASSLPPATDIRRGSAGKLAGDFLASVPPGFDAYVMKNVIHNWPRRRCEQLLRNIHDAMLPTSGREPDSKRLLLFEMVLTDGRSDSVTAFTNLNLNLLVDGGGRTVGEFDSLLAQTGFKLLDVTELPGVTRSVISAGLS